MPDQKTITVIDYGMGNIGSVVNMIKKAGGKPIVSSSIDDIYSAERILLPGVGSFDAGVTQLKEKKLFDPIIEVVNGKKTPLLGLCLGMQLLFNKSEEGVLKGLGLVEGEVKKFISTDTKLKIPHMAWNKVSLERKNDLMEGLDENRFYFVHSYYVNCLNEVDKLGLTNYIIDFVSIVQNGNIYGAQFHPEKSHKYGLRIFQNFLSI